MNTKSSPRGKDRMTGIGVGVLYIVATVTHVAGTSMARPFLNAPDYLAGISAGESRVVLGSLLILLAAFASAGIAIFLYPVLRKHNEGFALGSVVFRGMEGMLYIVTVIGVLSLVTLGQAYVKASASDASAYQASGTLMLAIHQWAGQLGVIAFTVGGLMYYYVFYQSRLVPRWIAGWGFLGAAMTLASALLAITGQLVPLSTVFILFNLPIAVQEMVLAVWLIVKGFNPTDVALVPAKTATNELATAA